MSELRIELRTLGGLDVRGADGHPVAAAFSRPKPLALLVYLALARPRGFHSQDALLALFWPEADGERARLSLRQTVYVLRRALGEGVVIRRGRGELGLDPSHIRCDAVQFEQALADGRRADALALYQGDLLPAYFIPDAPDAERWLDTERARLRTLALDAVRTLADAAAADDDPAAAARWARRWAALAPDDERPVHCVLGHLERAGDFAGALQLYDAFAAQRAHDEEGEPSPALQQRARRLCALAAAVPAGRDMADTAPADVTEPAPEVVPEVVPAAPVDPTLVDPTPVDPTPVSPTPAVALLAPPIAARVTEPPRPGRRRGRALLVGGVVLALAGIALTGRRAPARLPIAADEGHATNGRVVVLPFVVRGGAESAYLREAMVELLSAKLDGVAGMTAVDPRVILTYDQTAPAGAAPPTDDIARGQAAARRFGAGQFVLGSVIAVGGQLEATAALYDTTGQRHTSADAAGSREAALFTVADALARALVGGELRGPDAHLDRAATTTTTSLPALKAFLEGEQRLRDGQADAAAEAYERAVRFDSTFALAHYRLSTTTAWSAQPALVHRATQQARRYADRLPRAEQLLLRGNAASDAGNLEEAEGLYQAVLVLAPDLPEASRQLGELRFHLGPWRGRPAAAARDAFERVAAVDPLDANAWLHLARIAALTGRLAAADSIAAHALGLRVEPGVALELRALRAAVSGDQSGARQTLALLRPTVGRQTAYNDDDAWLVAWRVATYADAPAFGRVLTAALTAPGVAPRLQLLGHTAAAHMDAARGRWAAADAELATASQFDPLYAAEVRANLALIRTLSPAGRPNDGMDAGVVARARAALGRATAAAPIGGAVAAREAAAVATDRVTRDRDAFLDTRRPYLLGVLALAAGDTGEATRQARTLATAGRAPGTAGELGLHLAHELAARRRWARGDAAGALHEVEAGWPGGARSTGLPLFRGETYTQATERVFRGDVLRALGRDREALAWYASATEDLGATVALSAPAHLRQAALLERLGDRAEARAQYARAAALWADADPAFQPAVRAARQRAAALR